MSEPQIGVKRTGMSLYTMKGTRDWDASMWYRGGFRAIALPKCYIADKAAKEAATRELKGKGTAWDFNGFFSTNNRMSVYRAEILRSDPEYQRLVKIGGQDPNGAQLRPLYAKATRGGANVEAVEREMVGQFNDKVALKKFGVNATESAVFGKGGGKDPGKTDRWVDRDKTDTAKDENPNTYSQLVEDRTLQNDDYSDLIQRVVDDTALGGNDAMNCYWSYNEDDDIVHPQTAYNRSLADNYAVNLQGMGRVYAENIQKYQQILWMNFGLPVYKGSITSLFGGSASTAYLINRGNTLAAKIGYFLGTVVKIAFVFPLLPLYGILALCDLFNTYPISKYFEHRTAMPMYFKFCNILIGHMAVNLGLYKAIEADLTAVKQTGADLLKTVSFGLINIQVDEVDTKKTDDSKVPAPSQIYKVCNVGTPEVLKHGPDILAIMYRKSLKNRMYDALLQKKLADNMFLDSNGQYKNYLIGHQSSVKDKDGKPIDIAAAYQALDKAKKEFEEAKAKGEAGKGAMEAAQKRIDAANKLIAEYNAQTHLSSGFMGLGFLFGKQDWGNLFGMMFGTALQSIDYIGFKVEKTTSVSESISNSTEPLEIAGTINGLAQQGRSKKDSLFGTILGGKTGIWGVDQIAQFINGLFNSVVDAVGMGNMVNVITGNGFVDIPERWSSSSFSRSYNVEIQLRARYGDPVSWLQSIGIPLACLLAGGMPRGIGSSMYTSPFLVRCYCKGMFSIPTGIIESISMTRGDAEYGWSLNRLPLSLNVQLGIKDLSPILYIGMDNDMNTSMDEYMSTLTGLGLYERAFRFPQYLRRINRALLIARNTWANPLWWGNEMGDTGIAKLGAGIYSLATGNGFRVLRTN